MSRLPTYHKAKQPWPPGNVAMIFNLSRLHAPLRFVTKENCKNSTAFVFAADPCFFLQFKIWICCLCVSKTLSVMHNQCMYCQTGNSIFVLRMLEKRKKKEIWCTSYFRMNSKLTLIIYTNVLSSNSSMNDCVKRNSVCVCDFKILDCSNQPP